MLMIVNITCCHYLCRYRNEVVNVKLASVSRVLLDVSL